MVGNNTPIFFVRDASKFQDFIHSQKRRPGHRPALQRHAVGLLDPLAGELPPGDDPHVRPRASRARGATCTASRATRTRGSTPPASVLGQVPLQDRPGHRELHRGRGRARWPREDPDYHRRDLFNSIAAGDAPEWRLEVQIMPLRGGRGLPLQPVRPDEGLAARRLPADRGRPPGARPQPGELLRRGRAGRVQAREPRARHRPQPGQDADGPDLLLPRHAPAPHRPELRAAADQRAEGPGALLQQGRVHDLPPRRRPAGVRAELPRRAAGRPGRARRTSAGRSRPASSAATRTRSTPRTTTSARPGRCTAR